MPPEEPIELERVDMILDPPAPEHKDVCPTCGGKEIDGRCDLCQRSGQD